MTKEPSAILRQILFEDRQRKQSGDWRHPLHARGIRSQNMSRCHVEGLLTDRKINRYRKEGKYE